MIPIVFGTMRMSEHARSIDEWVSLLELMYSIGIQKIHVSREYESYSLFIKVYKSYRAKVGNEPFDFICKLAEPHFSDTNFSKDRLLEKVHGYQKDLECDVIDTVQWMWRSNESDEIRCAQFRENLNELRSAFHYLRKSGIVKNIYCFPYSLKFLDVSISESLFDGYTLYLNTNETDYVSLFPLLPEKSVTCIRPFGAGKLLTESSSTDELLEFVYSFPQVNHSIISISKESQLSDIKRYFGV